MSGDFVKENAIIDEGPPARYGLRVNKINLDGDESKLIRLTLGKKDPSKSNKTILLVGETGSGKSAFINTFLNYAMGTRKEDKSWYEIVDENTETSKSGSVTSKVTVYEIFGYEGQTLPFSLTIIDTPGYGDTRGLENDGLIATKLHDLFRSDDGIHVIDAVGLVMKASDNRLSDRLRYIFDSVMSLFGKDLEKNIVALVTHSDGMPPTVALKALQDANIQVAKNERNQPVHFVFNNCLSTKITGDTEFGLEQAWAVTTRGMNKFTAFLEQNPPQRLEITVQVLNEQIRLVACVNNLADKIELNKKKQEEIKQTQDALKKYQEELKSGKSFSMEVDEPYKEKEDIDGGMVFFMFGAAVTCSVCEENCHYPGCTLAWWPQHCKVMKKGRCTVCTRKCPADQHVKEKKKYVINTRKVTRTIEQLKKMYEDNQKLNESLLSKLQNEKETLETEIKGLLDEAYNHVINLEGNALSLTSSFSLINLDILYDEVKKTGDTEKVQKLEEIKQQMNKGIMANLYHACVEVKGNIAKTFKKLVIK